MNWYENGSREENGFLSVNAAHRRVLETFALSIRNPETSISPVELTFSANPISLRSVGGKQNSILSAQATPCSRVRTRKVVIALRGMTVATFGLRSVAHEK